MHKPWIYVDHPCHLSRNLTPILASILPLRFTKSCWNLKIISVYGCADSIFCSLLHQLSSGRIPTVQPQSPANPLRRRRVPCHPRRNIQHRCGPWWRGRRPGRRKRTFLVSAVLSFIAALALIITVGLLLPAAMGWWSHPTLTQTILPTTTTITPLNPLESEGVEASTLLPISGQIDAEKEDRRVATILKLVALLGAGILVAGTLVCGVVSIINYRRTARDFDETIKYTLAPRASTAYQDPRVDKMITDL